ncbi:MAG: hypothetical protein MJ240_02200 [Kiritimatiellae bacterium]|nr:hypothetical protein [Kiritimatiellia bacterium]
MNAMEKDPIMSDDGANASVASDENALRKRVWERRDAVDAKLAEEGFAALSPDERDAWVVSLQLEVPLEVALHGIAGSAQPDEKAQLHAALETTFKYGKRKALRALKDVLARHRELQKLTVRT